MSIAEWIPSASSATEPVRSATVSLATARTNVHSNDTRAARRTAARSLIRRREALADGVLGDDAGLDELEEVVRAPGLRADARQAEPAERLASDRGTGDRAVDVEVAGTEG